MPKQVSETEWDQMVSAITAHPEGMKIDAISKCIKFDLSFDSGRLKYTTNGRIKRVQSAPPVN